MWKALQKGWVPPKNISMGDWKYLKKCQDIEDPALVAFAGFMCSFGGKWFAGYAKNKKGDNYADRGSRMLVKQILNLKDVLFKFSSYLDLEIPNKSIIYCDPPYAGTTQYKMNFNHERFWAWCIEKSNEGHSVFISEYSAPDCFIPVCELEHATRLDRNQEKRRVEKLFKFDPILL